MRMPPPPGRLVDVGGHRLHLFCAGAGMPVVFESALGASSLVWRHIQSVVSSGSLACAYDRAGFGWSDAGPLPRTAGRIVSELRVLLHTAHVEPPYVLVGHSFGGLTARLYAQRHPEEVAGLLLLDPADPAQWRRPSADRAARVARGVSLCGHGARAARLGLADLVVVLVKLGALNLARACARLVSSGELGHADEGVLVPAGKLPPGILPVAIRSWTQPRFFEALGSQIASIADSAAEVPDDQDFGDLPVIAVSSGLDADAAAPAHHLDLARRSRRGEHLVADGSGHWIPLDRPDVVIDAIRRLVDLVRPDAGAARPAQAPR
jgi:pimeloyl-ACP methyl ester carboxylesterase